jgi:type I restriction enzyme S subunit
MADVRHSGTPDHLAGGNLLPEGWVRTQLHTISEIVTGKTPSKKEPGYFNGKIPFIKPGDILDQGLLSTVEDSLSDEGAGQVPNIPEGSIVVTCIGNLGRCAITTKRSATNQQINGVVPVADVNLWFLYYQIRTLKEWMLTESSATTVTIINKSKFSQAPIALPPLAEQKVIAEKLDTLLAQVDTTKARLERIPDIIKRFRQSVLAAAVSGKLTEEWREENKQLTAEKRPLSFAGKIIAGQSPSKHEVNFEGRGEPYVTGPEQWDGRKILHHKWTEHPKRMAPEGSIFVTVKGAGVGTTFPGCYAAIGRDVYAFVPNESMNRTYILLAIQASAEEVVLKAKGLIPGLTKSDIIDHDVYIPKLEEQLEIVRHVEELFAFADTIEQKAAAALERVNNLTQSILAKAFRGELTADWRAANLELISGDNSAEALLAKIQAEREALALEKKEAKKNRKKKD